MESLRHYDFKTTVINPNGESLKPDLIQLHDKEISTWKLFVTERGESKPIGLLQIDRRLNELKILGIDNLTRSSTEGQRYQNVGTALMEFAVSLPCEEGRYIIAIVTQDSKGFYLKCGFIEKPKIAETQSHTLSQMYLPKENLTIFEQRLGNAISRTNTYGNTDHLKKLPPPPPVITSETQNAALGAVLAAFKKPKPR